MKLFSGTINILENSVSYATTKQKTITNNIANADTPHYKAKEVEFSALLNQESKRFENNRTDPRHIKFHSHQPVHRIKENTNTTYNSSGNNVDIDKEMSELAKNQIYYQALIDRLNGKFNSLKTVIKGGS